MMPPNVEEALITSLSHIQDQAWSNMSWEDFTIWEAYNLQLPKLRRIVWSKENPLRTVSSVVGNLRETQQEAEATSKFWCRIRESLKKEEGVKMCVKCKV